MGLSNKLSHEAGSLYHPRNPHRFFQRFEALFPCTETLGCTVCLAPQLFLPVYPHVDVGPPGPPAPALPRVFSAPAAVSAPPTSLNECFFFNSWVVRLPYSLIFCQLWLFFVFKYFVVLLLVVRGGKVYLPTRPSCPEVSIINILNNRNVANG